MFSKTKSNIWTLGLVLLLTACGGGGGGSDDTPATQNISVVPALGAFGAGATVKAFDLDGTELGSGTTDANGMVSALAIPKSYAGGLILRVSGGSFFDEGQRTTVSLGSDAMLSVVPADRMAANASYGITPLTNVVASLAGLDASSTQPALANSEVISTAITKFQLIFPVDLDVLAAPAPFKSVTDMNTPKVASDASALYGVLLAELAKNAGAGSSALAQARTLATAAKGASTATDPATFATQLGAVTTPLLTVSDSISTSSLLTGTSESVQSFKAARNQAIAPAAVFEGSLAELQTLQNTQASQGVQKQAFQGMWSSDADPSWTVAVSADGTALALSQDATSLIAGAIKAADSGFTLDGVQITNNNGTFTQVSVSLPVAAVADTSLTLTVDGSNVVLAPQTRYATAFDVAATAGTWWQILGDYAKITLTVSTSGAITGTTSTGCTWSGQLAALSEAKALADVSLTETCNGTAATLAGFANIGSNGALNLLVYRNTLSTSEFLRLQLTKQ